MSHIHFFYKFRHPYHIVVGSWRLFRKRRFIYFFRICFFFLFLPFYSTVRVNEIPHAAAGLRYRTAFFPTRRRIVCTRYSKVNRSCSGPRKPLEYTRGYHIRACTYYGVNCNNINTLCIETLSRRVVYTSRLPTTAATTRVVYFS